MAPELVALIRTLDKQKKAGKRGAHGLVVELSYDQIEQIQEYLWRYLDLLQ